MLTTEAQRKTARKRPEGSEKGLTISFVRTLILYAFVVLALRIMGKRQVGELQPSELVVSIMISDLATIPMSDNSIPLLCGIIPILTLIAAELLCSVCALKSPKVRRLLTGAPSVIIKNGRLCRSEMSKNRYNIDDLTEALRMKGYFNVADVYLAVLETNGSLSVIPKSSKKLPDAGDLKLKTEQDTAPFVVIADGVVYKKQLAEAGLSRSWLARELKKRRTTAREVFLLTVDKNKKVEVQMKR